MKIKRISKDNGIAFGDVRIGEVLSSSYLPVDIYLKIPEIEDSNGDRQNCFNLTTNELDFCSDDIVVYPLPDATLTY